MEKTPPSILILNGPNINLLGMRDDEGRDTLEDLESACQDRAGDLGVSVEFRQSNYEGELVEWIQRAHTENDGIILNAGAYAHTSIAMMDALHLIDVPVIEVQISNIFKREAFRQHSYIAPVAVGTIYGLGLQGYLLAMDAMTRIIDRN